MGLMNTIKTVLGSPQGREAVKRGANWVKDPANQQKLRKLTDRGPKGTTGTGKA